jgi:hypothetical protein
VEDSKEKKNKLKWVDEINQNKKPIVELVIPPYDNCQFRSQKYNGESSISYMTIDKVNYLFNIIRLKKKKH